jgi:hypothetical protein
VSGCSRWNLTGGLPETSNCLCHPGIAGGSPAYASETCPSISLRIASSLSSCYIVVEPVARHLWRRNDEEHRPDREANHMSYADHTLTMAFVTS